MSPDQRLLAAFLVANAAIYVVLVFVAGILKGNDYAWKLSIACAGFTYISYMVQVSFPDYRSAVLLAFGASVGLGALAGLALLWKS